ncbi:bZIP transcription factor 60 [Benincasa hispida]|uniref:bZIP transcription factor 60 n=1 Tax=Benincasa hispida TaxID=102211 RepID=UPI0019003A0B|nr:bZIP transcription factor 60 [Benincasa hispida]
MEDDLHFSEYDELIGQIDWNEFFDGFPEVELPVVGDSTSPDRSHDSVSSWINQIENALMNDDEDKGVSLPSPTHDCCDSFLADVLVDSHGGPSVIDVDSNASDCGNDFGNSQEEDGHKVSPAPTDDSCGSFMPEVPVDIRGSSPGVDAVVGLPSNASDCGDVSNNSEKVDAANIDDSVGEDVDDSLSKKRRRQLRNRDAAVRSRERKKMYLKDLEMKSKFLEAECRRLGRLLQCYCAENQALRFSLQMGGASGASLTKQESAVLLLESLLLGSLLWLVGTVCLFTLPQLPQSTLEPVPGVTMEDEGPGSAPLNERENNDSRYSSSSIQTRRCKAARTRMKPIMLDAMLRPSSALISI